MADHYAESASSSTIDSSPVHSMSTSSAGSYFTTTTANTQITTPGEINLGGFHTIILAAKDLGSLKTIDHAFIEFEPFKTFVCTFCSQNGGSSVTCKCQALATTDIKIIPSTKKKLLRYLEEEETEASHIKAATLTYLLALEQHVPFGVEFNFDQQTKCGLMNTQLDLVKNRIVDIKKALDLLPGSRDAVPEGLLSACTHFRPVLANCLGNARENHICFKLNFKLFTK